MWVGWWAPVLCALLVKGALGVLPSDSKEAEWIRKFDTISTQILRQSPAASQNMESPYETLRNP